ncbi:nucleotide-binding protein [Nostoc sp.]
MIIGLTNQKGGAGKTTVSGHLAYWLSQRGTVRI